MNALTNALENGGFVRITVGSSSIGARLPADRAGAEEHLPRGV